MYYVGNYVHLTIFIKDNVANNQPTYRGSIVVIKHRYT